MSKHINDIYTKILESNRDLYSGPSELIKDIQILKKHIKDIEKKIDEIFNVLIQSINER